MLGENSFGRKNIILNRIRQIRADNNNNWLKLFQISGIIGKYEMEEVTRKRLKNNEKLINVLKVIFNNDIEEGKEIFKEIIKNDKKVFTLCEKLMEE